MKIDQDVLNVLADAEVSGNTLKLTAQLDRALYIKVDKVLKALGCKWNRKTGNHVSNVNIEEKLEQAIQSGEYTDEKKEYQFFPTPAAIADQLVELACLQDGDVVLEPSAGHGAILDAIVRSGVEWGCVHVVELNPDSVAKLEENWGVYEGDYLNWTNNIMMPDVIIANPPFTKQQDIDHVNKMLDDAKRTVVSIMSASVLWRDNKKAVEFRERVESLGGEFIELPEGAFKESGTLIKTVICKVNLNG